jgi:hypothetical protein
MPHVLPCIAQHPHLVIIGVDHEQPAARVDSSEARHRVACVDVLFPGRKAAEAARCTMPQGHHASGIPCRRIRCVFVCVRVRVCVSVRARACVVEARYR